MANTSDFEQIRMLLHDKADLNVRLCLIPYEGTPEVKKRGQAECLYMRRRVAGKLTSTYVGAYSEELHQLLLRNAAEARNLRKQIRRIDKRLAALGFADEARVTPGGDTIDTAIELCLYRMKAQAFLDGNMRAAIIFANHCLIAR